jgi:hypothetical protein
VGHEIRMVGLEIHPLRRLQSSKLLCSAFAFPIAGTILIAHFKIMKSGS